MENRHSGNHPEVNHSTALFTAFSARVCQTMAHAPIPATASVMPTIAPATRPAAFETATIRTSIRFIRRLVCTMAEAFRINERNITRLPRDAL